MLCFLAFCLFWLAWGTCLSWLAWQDMAEFRTLHLGRTGRSTERRHLLSNEKCALFPTQRGQKRWPGGNVGFTQEHWNLFGDSGEVSQEGSVKKGVIVSVLGSWHHAIALFAN